MPTQCVHAPAGIDLIRSRAPATHVEIYAGRTFLESRWSECGRVFLLPPRSATISSIANVCVRPKDRRSCSCCTINKVTARWRCPARKIMLRPIASQYTLCRGEDHATLRSRRASGPASIAAYGAGVFGSTSGRLSRPTSQTKAALRPH
jgi:hypothetical protein